MPNHPYSAPLAYWCDECGKPITTSAPGYIRTDRDAIDLRRDLLDDWYKRYPASQRSTADARAEYPRTVAWSTVHEECNQWPQSRSQAIACGLARNERMLLKLSAKLFSKKRWLVHTGWAAFIVNTLAASEAEPTNGEINA